MDFVHLIQDLNLGTKRYKIISYEDSLKLNEYTHAAHCGIYSLNSHFVDEELYSTKAALMMLFRSDGKIGFPGGFIDHEINIMQGLKREIKEEINLDIDKLDLPDPTYLVTYQYSNESVKLCCHFYKLKVSIEAFRNIEKDVFNSRDFGNEIFGVLRVPLYTMKDGYCGLPSFLCNNFVANSRDQLLVVIAVLEVLTMEEILKSANIYKHIMSLLSDNCNYQKSDN